MKRIATLAFVLLLFTSVLRPPLVEAGRSSVVPAKPRPLGAANDPTHVTSGNRTIQRDVPVGGTAVSTASMSSLQGGGNQVFYPCIDEVSDIAASDHGLWIATGSSLIWSNPETGRWWPQGRYADRLDTHDQDLWVVGSEVSVFDGTTWTEWTTWTAEARGPSADIEVDSIGRPWFLSESAVSRYDGTEWERTVTGPEYPDWANFNQIVVIGHDEAWVTSSYNGLLHIDGVVTETFTTADGLVSDRMVSLAYDPVSGAVWVGSDGSGISYGDGATWTSITTANSDLLSNRIRTLAAANGNLWIGYEDVKGQIGRHTTTGITHLPLPQPFASSEVSHLNADPPATLWVGLDDGTVLRYDEAGQPPSGTWSIATQPNGPRQYTTQRVFHADHIYTHGPQGTSQLSGSQWLEPPYEFTAGTQLGPGNFWLSDPGHLHHSTDGETWHSDTLGSDIRVTRIVSDPISNHLWLGTESGLWKYDPATSSIVDTWSPTTEASTSGDFVKDLEVTAEGSIWLIAGSEYKGTITHFDPDAGIWTPYYPDILTLGLAQTSDGTLWFATANRYDPSYEPSSLRSYDNGTWSVYTKTQGLPWDSVYDVAVDTTDRVWTMGQVYGRAENQWQNWTGFSVLDGGTFTSYSMSPGISSHSEMWLDVGTGDLWAPTSPYGILRFNAEGLAVTGEISDTETVITSADGSGEVRFPSGFLAAGSVVTLTSTSGEDSGPLKSKSSILEVNWPLTGASLHAADPYTITLSYVKPTLGPYNTRTLGLYQWNSETSLWEKMTSSIHNEAHMEFTTVANSPGTYQIMMNLHVVYLPLTLRQ